jgi:peptidoglycan/LPS O-acetylase OafA/YrhL
MVESPPIAEEKEIAPAPRSVALDGYRALAITIVMLNHARFAVGYPDWLVPMAGFIKGGVTAFMVLSGYLVTLSLLKEEARSGVMGGWAFLRRQAVRLYVPAIAYLAVVCVWFSDHPRFLLWKSVRVLWGDPNTATSFPWSGHLYSLAAQLQFFVWWPLALRIIPRGHRLLPVTVLMVLGVAWRTLGKEWAILDKGNYLRTDFVYGSLLVGAWWALLVQKGRMEWILRLRGLQLLPLVGAAVFVIVFTRSPSQVLGVFSDDLRDWVAPWRERFPVVVTIRALAALAGMMAFGCLSFLLHRGRPARLAQLFSLPVVTWLGRISFSVYLWQNIFCFGVTRTWADRFPLSLLASVGCGYLTYRLVELPSLRWRSRLKRPTVEPPGTPMGSNPPSQDPTAG